ncbi:hypothetical protein BK128_10575 [Viridibacillus sp. FSL H7-0596]|uniref:hypothetical protein n=1 Tax=Viridibacillus sp. FSL H7-0596 TaxID=1928923 RepID=UPI00097015C6|nr:hypothetical protein [Viridibacillus sp. FSL H7-0596]OMC86504.1 hypothetical protein BK128_10575 [Viridibacillus sp. FSL H7-0596]
MKKIIGLSFILFAGIILSGCSDIIEDSLDSSDRAAIEIATKRETGNGSIELLTPTITTKDNQLEFITEGIDENKVTFIFVANKKVFEQKIKNDESYKLDINGIKDAHKTDYKPKVQLLQTIDDTEDGDIVTFKQVRYTVKKD